MPKASRPQEFGDPHSQLKEMLDEHHSHTDDSGQLDGQSVKPHLEQALGDSPPDDVKSHIDAALRRLQR